MYGVECKLGMLYLLSDWLCLCLTKQNDKAKYPYSINRENGTLLPLSESAVYSGFTFLSFNITRMQDHKEQLNIPLLS
jgi:hypothetical protein